MPDTSGPDAKVSRLIFIILFIVFIAAIPVAPFSIAAIAGTSIFVIFGVILARIGSVVPLLVAAVYLITRSLLVPTSLPRPSPLMWGHEKLHSIISAPALVHTSARYVHSSSLRPIIEAIMTFVG